MNNPASESQELEIFPAIGTRSVDLRDRATDSWTDVLVDVINLARGIAGTDFVPRGVRCDCNKTPCTCGGVERTTASILYSRELGLPPMTGLGGTHVVEGRPGISAELMRSLILQAGHQITYAKRTDTECVMRGRRKGTEEWTDASFTISEAARIKFKTKEGWKALTTKANWMNYPGDMLVARTTTRLARMLFPDVIHGMRSAEELEDQVEVVATSEVPPAEPRVSRAKPKPATVEVVQSPAPAVRASVPLPAPVATAAPPQPPPPRPPLPTPIEEPEPVDQDEQDEQVEDAEMVEDEPVATTLEPPAEQAISSRQIAFIQMQFTRLLVADRAEKLFWLGQVLGREVGSSKELAFEEGKKVANVLEQLRDHAALEALGADS